MRLWSVRLGPWQGAIVAAADEDEAKRAALVSMVGNPSDVPLYEWVRAGAQLQADEVPVAEDGPTVVHEWSV